MNKQIDIHSHYGQQIIRAILIICDKKEIIGVNNLYDSDIYDVVEVLKEQGIKSSYKDAAQVLDKLMESIKEVKAGNHEE